MRKGASGIILVLVTALGPSLELRHNEIITSCSFTERSHMVMDFFSSIDTHNHISHFFVAEFHNFIIYQDTIGRKGKTEIFIMDFFLLSSVCHQIFDHLPVHQRLAAKEIHFQVSSAAGIGNQKIQCLFSNFEGHQCTSSMVFPFFCKAVSAGQVTVMGNMQTECLHYRRSVFKMLDGVLINIFCKQHPLLFQRPDFFQGCMQIFFSVLLFQLFYYTILISSLIQKGNTVIYNIIHHMDRTTVHIQHNGITVAFILVNHVMFSFLI